jgi:methylmalonyl-CoA mutase N-terminal domain/subunit
MQLKDPFALCLIMGYDPDHPWAKGEVGKCGVSVASIKDMEQLFKDIDLGGISVSQTINGPAMILLAFYIAVAENQGVPLANLRGTLQNDILKEFIAQKEWIFPPQPSMRIITDMMAFCSEHMPQFNTISISGYHIKLRHMFATKRHHICNNTHRRLRRKNPFFLSNKLF